MFQRCFLQLHLFQNKCRQCQGQKYIFQFFCSSLFGSSILIVLEWFKAEYNSFWVSSTRFWAFGHRLSSISHSCNIYIVLIENIGISILQQVRVGTKVWMIVLELFIGNTQGQRWMFLRKTNISSWTPKMALHENPGAPGSWPVIFLHEAQKRQFFCT